MEIVNSYVNEIKNAKNKNEIKNIVRVMFKNNNLSDTDFTDIINEDIYLKLQQLGVKIPMFNDNTCESFFEVILKENY